MTNVCHVGDCRDVMRGLIADGVRVQMCVTSPPYYGLRDYGHAGQLGLEPSPAEYIANMVEVFGLVRDLLADDGVLWLNIGDSYAGSWGAQGRPQGDGQMVGRSVTSARQISAHPRFAGLTGTRGQECGMKPKDLMGIPWMLAFALRADGWYLRSDIIWHKPNPMPESILDRPTKAHEYLFLLAKSERYFYDAAAVQEPLLSGPSDLRKMVEQQERTGGKHKALIDPLSAASSATNVGRKRSVGSKQAALAALGKSQHHRYAGLAAAADASESGELLGRNRRTVWTIATEPYGGAHFAVMPTALVEPCILAGSRPGDTVLDPFFGSGTVGQVAEQLGRQWLGIELNPAYIELSRKRTAQQGMVLA